MVVAATAGHFLARYFYHRDNGLGRNQLLPLCDFFPDSSTFANLATLFAVIESLSSHRFATLGEHSGESRESSYEVSIRRSVSITNRITVKAGSLTRE